VKLPAEAGGRSTHPQERRTTRYPLSPMRPSLHRTHSQGSNLHPARQRHGPEIHPADRSRARMLPAMVRSPPRHSPPADILNSHRPRGGVPDGSHLMTWTSRLTAAAQSTRYLCPGNCRRYSLIRPAVEVMAAVKRRGCLDVPKLISMLRPGICETCTYLPRPADR
jgi:hypothetical protein